MEIEFSPLLRAARRASEWQSGFDPRPGLLASNEEGQVLWAVQSGAGWLRQQLEAKCSEEVLRVGVSGYGLFSTLQDVHGMDVVELRCDGLQFELNPGTAYEDSAPLTDQWSTPAQADALALELAMASWSVSLLADDLAQVLQLGCWAAANEATDQALAQVELHLDADAIRMVAGNGIKLATATATALAPVSEPQLLVLPAAMASRWLAVVRSMPETARVTITRHARELSLHFGSREVVLISPASTAPETGLFSLLGDLETRQPMALAQMEGLDRKRVKAVCAVSQAVMLSTTETGMALTTQHKESLGRHRSAELDVGGAAQPGEIAIDAPELHAALQLMDGAVSFSICHSTANRILLLEQLQDSSVQPRIGLVALNI